MLYANWTFMWWSDLLVFYCTGIYNSRFEAEEAAAQCACEELQVNGLGQTTENMKCPSPAEWIALSIKKGSFILTRKRHRFQMGPWRIHFNVHIKQ